MRSALWVSERMATTVSKPAYDGSGALLVRDVLGDGSCGYRAVMFGMLEHDWVKTLDRLPAAVAATLPDARPPDLAGFFDRHDAALCAAARSLVAHRILHDAEIHEWAGDPRDADTEAGQAHREVTTPHAYMDEVALHALAKALDARIAIKFQHDVLVAPFKDNTDRRPVSVCLKPLADRAPSEFVGHYMLCYPGVIKGGGVVSVDPWARATTRV